MNAVEEIAGYILKVSMRLFQCKGCRDAGMKRLDLIWVDTDKYVDPTRKKIRSRLRAREYKTSKVRFNELYPLLNCSPQCHLLKP